MNKVGTGDPFLDRLVVVAAVLLFSGTASVMSYHAPEMLNQIVGADISYIFGVVSALCVEAGALRLHFNKRAQNVPAAHYVKWILLGISGLCQMYNGEMTTGDLSQMSETLKIMFVWLVPNIPLLFIVLQFWVGHLPEVDEDGSVVETPRKPSVGLKNRIGRLWHGEKENTVRSHKITIGQPVFVPDEEPDEEPEPASNGSNPTNRQSP